MAALLAMVAPQTPVAQPPRPSDARLLEAVLAETPGGRILSSAFGPTPRGGGWNGCGLIERDGVIEPFAVLTLWKEAQTSAVIISRITTRDEDGRPVTHEIPPPPAESSQWAVSVSVAKNRDLAGDGIDRFDRNMDVLSRKRALASCPDLVPPAGVVWAVDLEPHPDPARERRSRERARALTDMIFGPTSNDGASRPATER
jgi:hypothetical protein